MDLLDDLTYEDIREFYEGESNGFSGDGRIIIASPSLPDIMVSVDRLSNEEMTAYFLVILKNSKIASSRAYYSDGSYEDIDPREIEAYKNQSDDEEAGFDA